MEPKLNHSSDYLDFNLIYTNFFDLIYDFVFILDSEGKIIKVNKAFIERIGFSMEELLNKSVLVVHPPERRDEAASIVEKMLKGEADLCDVPILTKDGRLIPVETKITRGKIQDKDVILGISRDITEHKKAENSIKEKNIELSTLNRIITLGNESQNLQEFLKKSYDQVLESVAFDRGGVYLYNPKTQHNKLVLHKNVHPEFIAAVEDANISEGLFSKVFDKYKPFYIEDFSEFMEGSKELDIYSVAIVPLRSKEEYVGSMNVGSPVHQKLSQNELDLLVGIGKQMGIIIQKFEAEDRLRESEEKFRGFLEYGNIGMAITSVDKKWLYSNDQISEMLGYTREELHGMTWAELTYPEDLQPDVQQFNKMLEGEIDSYQMDKRFIKKRGDIVHVHLTVSCIRNSDGSVKHVLATLQDITDRKRSEEALIQEKIFTDTSINTQRDTFFIFEPSTGKPIRWNKAFNDVSGYSDEEILKLNAPISYYSEEDLKRLAGSTKLIEQGKTTLTEANLITKYGKTIPFEYSASGIFDVDKNLKYIVAIGRDITERKKSEHILEDIARFPSENPNPVLRANSNEILYANQSGKELFNIQNGSKVPELLKEYISKSISSNKNQVIELLLENHVFSFTISPIIKTGYVNIYGTDISELKKAEQQLIKSEHFLQERVKELSVLYEFSTIASKPDVTTKELLISLLKILPSAWQYPEITRARISFDKEIFQTENFRESKWKLSKTISINGTLITIEVFYLEEKPFIEEETNLLNEIGIRLRSFIEYKEAEQKLIESEEKFRSIFEAIPDIYFLISGDTTILDYRGSFNEFYIPPDAFLGKKISDVMPEEIAKKALSVTKKVLETKQPQVYEYNLIIENKTRTYEARHMYLSEDRVSAFVRDITDRKESEIKLLESMKTTQTLIEDLPLGIHMYQLKEDGKLYFIRSNPAADKLLQVANSQYIGKTIEEAFPNIVESEVHKKLYEIAEKGGYWRNEEIVYEDEMIKGVFENYNFQPRPGHVISMFNDISERKIAEQKLIESEAKYREAFNRANFYKDLFAHDMSNVFNSILLSVDLISETPKSLEKMNSFNEMFNIIKESTIRGVKLIKNVQKLSRLEDSDFNIQSINLITFLKDAKSFIKNTYPNKKINIKIEPFLEESNVNANELILDVFENLLINAVKYNDNQVIEI